VRTGSRRRYGRGMTSNALEPGTTWEYCLSAADELVLWHLQQGENLEAESERPSVVVLIAAATYALSSSISLEGSQIAHLALGSPGGAGGILGVVRHRPLAALRGWPADAMGRAETDTLIAERDSDSFEAVRSAAESVITHHVRSAAEAGRPHPTILDRALVELRARVESAGGVDVDGARSRQQYLTTDGMIWVVYDGGDTRLPILCGRCQTNTALMLRVDAEAGRVRIVCPDRHVTRDPRLSTDVVLEAIVLKGASRAGDIEIRGAELPEPGRAA